LEVSFELGKSISLINAEEEEAARHVHATHERLVIVFDEFDPKLTRRPTGSIRPSGSSKGDGVTPEAPDESVGIFTTLKEGTGITPGVPDEVKYNSKSKVNSAIDWGLENKSDYSKEDKVNEEEV
nr:hypothetical protein [Tanacetum cinerariifolium]